MFCPKCGKQLPDGALFCSGCGSKLGAPEQPAAPQQPAAPAQPAPQPAPAAPAAPQPAPAAPAAPAAPRKPASLPKFLAAKPSPWSWICTFLALLFTILPVYYVGGRFPMFIANIFNLSVAAGLGLIFMILGILVFLLRFVASVINFNKIIKIKLNFEIVLQFAFLLINLLVLFLAFIAAVSTRGLHLWVWWYFALIFTGGGLALSFLPDLFKFPKE